MGGSLCRTAESKLRSAAGNAANDSSLKASRIKERLKPVFGSVFAIMKMILKWKPIRNKPFLPGSELLFFALIFVIDA
jgi:hypothetical protein